MEKEGKFYAPIVNKSPKYVLTEGVLSLDGTRLVSGIKGVYAQVRIELPASAAGSKSELFALNTEMFVSS